MIFSLSSAKNFDLKSYLKKNSNYIFKFRLLKQTRRLFFFSRKYGFRKLKYLKTLKSQNYFVYRLIMKKRFLKRKKFRFSFYIRLKQQKFLNKYLRTKYNLIRLNFAKSKKKTNFKSNFYLTHKHLLGPSHNQIFFYLRRNKVKSSPHTLIVKFKNLFGKKKEKLFENVLVSLKYFLVEEKIDLSPVEMINKVLYDILFYCELKKKKIGSVDLLIPSPISKTRGFFLTLKLLLSNAKLRPEKLSLEMKIAKEIIETNKKNSLTYRETCKYNKTVSDNATNIRFVELSSFKPN